MSSKGHKLALISVSDKNGIKELAARLTECHFTIVASGGTSHYLNENGIATQSVQQLTNSAELLGGRVKTLHPLIHAGILCRSGVEEDEADMLRNGYPKIDIVVCNLYPFEAVANTPNRSHSDIVENIDIGGVSLLRSAAKNYERVAVLCDYLDYHIVIDELRESPDSTLSLSTRERLALKAFSHVAQYDAAITDYYRKKVAGPNAYQIQLRYGMNPHQKPAQLYTEHFDKLPIKILNGSPGFVNVCDALNAWQLVRELKDAGRGLPAATSFKHASPAGAAYGLPISASQAKAYMLKEGAEQNLSSLAAAYVRARGTDRMSSYGDFIALSDVCDVSTARVIAPEVSDGIIAPGYEEQAYEILRKKKGGSYCIMQIDALYEPPKLTERRNIFGLTLEQRRNDALVREDILSECPTASQQSQLPESVTRDLLLATITVKYTQSNSVCLAVDGQTVGIGAGQQSRIHCTRLASDKADTWWLRQHPYVTGLKFRDGVNRAVINNCIEEYVTTGLFPENSDDILATALPPILTLEEKRAWLAKLEGVSLSSDAFFPFPDNVERAAKSGVRYIVCPRGSKNDELVVETCKKLGVTMYHTDLRLFHH